MSEIIKLTRSTVEKYLSCPRCCVLDKKYKIKPPSLPFTLNMLLIIYVKMNLIFTKNSNTSFVIEKGIDAIPFKHS